MQYMLFSKISGVSQLLCSGPMLMKVKDWGFHPDRPPQSGVILISNNKKKMCTNVLFHNLKEAQANLRPRPYLNPGQVYTCPVY